MKKHFVTFYSPGTLVAETTEKPIDEWDVDVAMEMAHEVVERHGATPYGFRFTTRERTDDELDSKVTDHSGMYFLGGTIMTLEQVKADPESTPTLISNMEANMFDRVIVNKNSFSWTMPLDVDDVVLEWEPRREQRPESG